MANPPAPAGYPCLPPAPPSAHHRASAPLTMARSQSTLHPMIRLLTTLFLVAGAVAADPSAPADAPVPATEPAPEQPNVVDLGEGRYRIGLVTFDQATREISFPAEINMAEGLLEYAIVHETGKIHESLLHTKTKPLHVNLALKLLRYQGSEELFQVLDEDYRPTGKFPEVPEAVKTAARVELLLSWKNADGKPGQATLNELITNTVTSRPGRPHRLDLRRLLHPRGIVRRREHRRHRRDLHLAGLPLQLPGQGPGGRHRLDSHPQARPARRDQDHRHHHTSRPGAKLTCP